MVRIPIHLLTLTALVGCNRLPAPERVAALAGVAPTILSSVPESGPVSPSRWPALAALEPERVYTRPEGLYVVLSSFFVEERGLFTPRAADFSPNDGTDPSYTPIGSGVFSYAIKG